MTTILVTWSAARVKRPNLRPSSLQISWSMKSVMRVTSCFMNLGVENSELLRLRKSLDRAIRELRPRDVGIIFA